MKNIKIAVLVSLVGLVACGREASVPEPNGNAVEPVFSSEGLPRYESQGTIASVEGQIITLDHEGASAAALNPGRDRFRAYADVLAEAPLTPGSRVAFAFKKTPQGLELAELRARP